ncbi:MAG: hypothetical protein LBL74_07065 [Bacteroidales bacterium]|nr:hypothetical protein [Bacteroidales bacterium]
MIWIRCLGVSVLHYVLLRDCLVKMKQPFIRIKQPFVKIFLDFVKTKQPLNKT